VFAARLAIKPGRTAGTDALYTGLLVA
jgi:hypothetical protein